MRCRSIAISHPRPWKPAISACAASWALMGLAGCGSPATPSQNAAALVTQGLQAQLSGDLATASRDYLQAIRDDPYNAVAHYDLGTIDDRQGDTAQAVAQYTSTLEILPSFTDALFNLAVDSASANPGRAEVLYRQVVSLQPTFAAAWLNLGFVLQREGSVGEAEADWARAVSLDRTLEARLPSPMPSAAAAQAASTSPPASPRP